MQYEVVVLKLAEACLFAARSHLWWPTAVFFPDRVERAETNEFHNVFTSFVWLRRISWFPGLSQRGQLSARRAHEDSRHVFVDAIKKSLKFVVPSCVSECAIGLLARPFRKGARGPFKGPRTTMICLSIAILA